MSRLNLKTFVPILTAFLLVVAVACGSDEAEAPPAAPSSRGAASTPVPAAAAATDAQAATGGDA